MLSPIAGAMVDRYDRKLMRMVSDLTAVLATAGLLVIHASGHLQIWHLYIAAVVYLFFPVVRNLEDLLPDHNQLKKVKEGIA